jgi:hypothetical protein
MLLAARGVGFKAAAIDDALDAGLAIVFAPQDDAGRGEFHQGADMGATQLLDIGLRPAPAAPFVARAVVLILACGGNAPHGRHSHRPPPAPRGE